MLSCTHPISRIKIVMVGISSSGSSSVGSGSGSSRMSYYVSSLYIFGANYKANRYLLNVTG